MRRASLLLLACITLVGRASAATPSALVAIGDPSPLGLPFSRFSDVALDDRGRVAFVGATAAIFHKVGNDLVRVIGAGDSLGGGTLAGVNAPALGAADCLAFRAVFVGSGPAIVRRCTGDFEVVAAAGAAAPGDTTFAGFGPTVAVGAGGRVAFTALLPDGTTGLYLAQGDGTIAEITRTGAAAAAGGTYVAFRLVGVSASGSVGFRGQVSTGPDGLFRWDGAQVNKVVVANDASPAGGHFTAFGNASLNDSDLWAFRATVSDRGGGSTVPADGIFRADPTTIVPLITVVVLEGDPSPTGGTIRQIPTSLVPTINATGTVALRATLENAPDSAGIFVVPVDGPLALVVDVDEHSKLRRLRDPAVADDGSVLLRASLAKGAPGLFVARDQEVTPLALLGDATDLGSGFRFADSSVRAIAEDAVFLGLQEGLYVASGPGDVQSLATLGGATPIGGTYAGFDLPSGGSGGRFACGASVQSADGGRQALMVTGRRGLKAAVVTGKHVPGGGSIVDLFPDTNDALARASIGAGGIAINVTLGGTQANAGVFLAAGRRLRPVARAGTPAPTGSQYVAFGAPAVVSGGEVAFLAQVGGGITGVFLKTRGRGRTLAAEARDTKTRLVGKFDAFDPPAAASGNVAFHASLKGGLDGVFLARQRHLVVLAGSGDATPDAGRFRSFGPPTFAGSAVVFSAQAAGASAESGFYRVGIPPGKLAQSDVGAPEVVALVGDASPLGGSFVAFGTPIGNAHGALAFTADLVGAQAAGGVFVQSDTARSVP